MQRPGLGRGVDAQLVGKDRAQPLVRRQCARRLAGQRVGAQQDPHRGLVQRVGERGQLGQVHRRRRVAAAQGRLRTDRPRSMAQVVSSGTRRVDPRRGRLLGQDDALERTGRGVRRGSGQPRLTGLQAGVRLGDQPVGLGQVDDDLAADPPPRTVAADGLGAEHRTQPAHQRGHVLGRPFGLRLRPDQLGELLGRPDAARVAGKRP